MLTRHTYVSGRAEAVNEFGREGLGHHRLLLLVVQGLCDGDRELEVVHDL